jgi:glutamate:GABA antiporter
MLGVREQEANQLLVISSDVFYAINYIVLFALPVLGARALRKRLPAWLKLVSSAGLLASCVSLFIGVYPIVDVVSKESYAAKICGVVVIGNMIGVIVYRGGIRFRRRPS